MMRAVRLWYYQKKHFPHQKKWGEEWNYMGIRTGTESASGFTIFEIDLDYLDLEALNTVEGPASWQSVLFTDRPCPVVVVVRRVISTCMQCTRISRYEDAQMSDGGGGAVR